MDQHLRSKEQPLVTSNLRFLGFVNDVGEALHSFLPKSLYVRCAGRLDTMGLLPLYLSPPSLHPNPFPTPCTDWQLRGDGRVRCGGSVL